MNGLDTWCCWAATSRPARLCVRDSWPEDDACCRGAAAGGKPPRGEFSFPLAASRAETSVAYSLQKATRCSNAPRTCIRLQYGLS